jgi:hypothetical protein
LSRGYVEVQKKVSINETIKKTLRSIPTHTRYAISERKQNLAEEVFQELEKFLFFRIEKIKTYNGSQLLGKLDDYLKERGLNTTSKTNAHGLYRQLRSLSNILEKSNIRVPPCIEQEQPLDKICMKSIFPLTLSVPIV